jgi:hypothetical protein
MELPWFFYRGQNVTKEFAEGRHADTATISLLSLCSVDYLSGCNTRSNTHELMMSTLLKLERRYIAVASSNDLKAPRVRGRHRCLRTPPGHPHPEYHSLCV